MAGFPLPVEAWLEELLGLVMRMLANLEAPETRSDQGGGAASGGASTFLVEASSMYRWVQGAASAVPAARLHTALGPSCVRQGFSL